MYLGVVVDGHNCKAAVGVARGIMSISTMKHTIPRLPAYLVAILLLLRRRRRVTALITKVLIGRRVALLRVTVVTGLWGSKERCGLVFLNTKV